MKSKFSKFALTVSFLLAITLTFSCSSDDGGGNTVACRGIMNSGSCTDGPGGGGVKQDQ